jgi:hypothetical protein
MMEKVEKTVVNDLFFDGIELLISCGFRLEIRTKGKSMAPFMFDGEGSIMMKGVEDDSFQLGNLLLARLSDGRYVLHRLIKCEDDQVVLRGDNNLTKVEICTKNDIIAEAEQIKRFGKKIIKGSRMWNMYRNLWLGSLQKRRVILAINRRFPFILNLFFLSTHSYEI